MSCFEPMIHIVVPTHNRRARTEGFARCLTGQTYARYRLILVDDGSTDGTAEAVRAIIPEVTVITGAGDWWWGGGLQQGYDLLRRENPPASDLVLLINDDLTFEPDYLEKAVRFFSAHPEPLLLQSYWHDQDGGLIEGGTVVDWLRFTFRKAVDDAEINCLSTRGVFLRAGDFLRSGGFHPRLLPHYLSDYEFTLRAGRQGCRLTADPSVRIFSEYHQGGIVRQQEKSFAAAVRKLFSKRAIMNPVYFTTFILLSCPWALIPLNLLRVWIKAVGRILLRRV